jgi:hypothetical protein
MLMKMDRDLLCDVVVPPGSDAPPSPAIASTAHTSATCKIETYARIANESCGEALRGEGRRPQ